MIGRWFREGRLWAVAAMVIVAALLPTTTVAASTFIYDAPADTRVDTCAFAASAVGLSQLKDAQEASVSPSGDVRRTSTTPSGSVVATKPGTAISKACSFGGETRVLMADGTTKPISEIKPGDMVLAQDPETGEIGARKVTDAWVHDDDLVRLEIGGDIVRTTEDHPFWNDTDREWQRADQLDAGDFVLTADGRRVKVGVLVGSAGRGSAYNFTVEGLHTYHVLFGTDAVLVHNTCRFVDGQRVTTSEALTEAERWLGSGYKDMGGGRYVSADGTRVVRMGDGDILGKHGGGPHMNFETRAPNPAKPGKMVVVDNKHVYLTDSK